MTNKLSTSSPFRGRVGVGVKLYKLISHNQSLQERRHPMFEKNRMMKIFGYFFIAFWAAYVMMIGVALYFAFSDMSREAFDIIDGGLLFFLILDFFFRFPMQETPAQNVKQYKLMNIPTSFLLNTFLVRMGLQWFNLFWAFFFVPFGMLAIPQFYGFGGLLAYLFAWWLMFVFNSYWYLLWRTLMNRNMLYVIIPVLIYAALVYFGFFYNDNFTLFDWSMTLMRDFIACNPLCYLLWLAVVVPLYYINKRMQTVSIYLELSKTESVKSVKTNNMTWLDRFGTIGEYLKLEVKSTMRNMVVRKQFLMAVLFTIMFSAILAFTDIYDGAFMRVFIFVYCFSCHGIMTLTTVMCAEGNYIDGLMVRRETVLQLLKAKYYFNCCMLIIPLLFSIMPVVEGKMTMPAALGCMFFSSGIVYPFLFQLAVYNDTTIHLNEKITKSGNNSKAQVIMSLVAMFVPMIIMYTLFAICGEGLAAYIMVALGLIGTALHPLWLRNVYSRFMQRRHTIMDGFRNSKEQ